MISAVHIHGQEAGGDTHDSYSSGFSSQMDGHNQYFQSPPSINQSTLPRPSANTLASSHSCPDGLPLSFLLYVVNSSQVSHQLSAQQPQELPQESPILRTSITELYSPIDSEARGTSEAREQCVNLLLSGTIVPPMTETFVPLELRLLGEPSRRLREWKQNYC